MAGGRGGEMDREVQRIHVHGLACDGIFNYLIWNSLASVLVDIPPTVFKRRNRGKTGWRARWRSDGERERSLPTGGAFYLGRGVRAVARAVALSTCVHPCLSRQEYRLRRTSPRVATFRPFNLRASPVKNSDRAARSKLLRRDPPIEIRFAYKTISPRIPLDDPPPPHGLFPAPRRYMPLR